MKGSLLLEIHGWRGFEIDRELFCIAVRLGFVTLLVCRLSITDRMKQLRDKLDEIKKRLGVEE